MTASNKRGCCVNGKGSGVQEQQQRRRRRSSSSVGLLFRHLNISKEVPNTQGRDPTWSISISEFKRILDFKREKNGQINGDLDPWDEAYFTRLMKSSAYSLDSLVVASYFPLTQCIEGLKVLVELLFGVTFRSIPLAPRESWHTDVLKMSLYHPEEGQLFQLMQRLESTTPHFIRCIKPNNVQSPGMYEQELVLQQLRCYGVLEVVRISRSGFPTKMTHQKFSRRYGFLLLDNVASQDPLVFQLQFFISSIFCLRCIKLATQNCFSALASDRTKYYLLASFVLHIKHSESKDSAVSPGILLSGPTVMSRSYKHCREVLEYLNWISGRVPQKIMSMFFMEGNSGQPPKHLEVSRSSNGEDDEEWLLISEMHSRLEISWRDAKYGQRIQELNFSSFFIF